MRTTKNVRTCNRLAQVLLPMDRHSFDIETSLVEKAPKCQLRLNLGSSLDFLQKVCNTTSRLLQLTLHCKLQCITPLFCLPHGYCKYYCRPCTKLSYRFLYICCFTTNFVFILAIHHLVIKGCKWKSNEEKVQLIIIIDVYRIGKKVVYYRS